MAPKQPAGTPFEEIRRSFAEGRFLPVYFFCGSEPFLVDEAVELLIQSAVVPAARSFDLEILYGGEAGARQIASTAATAPMAGDRRVVIVREFQRVADRDHLIPYIRKPSPATCLALVSQKPDYRDRFHKTLREMSCVVEFPALKEHQIPSWVRSRASAEGREFGPGAAELLAAHVGTSLRDVRNALDKLMIFAGDRMVLTQEDVLQVIGLSRDFNVFELQRAVGERDTGKSLTILMRMLAQGENAVGIIPMLARYLQKLWLIHELRKQRASQEQIISALELRGAQAYFLDQYIAAANRYAPAELERGFRLLLEADEALKSSGGDERLVMTVMTHGLTAAAAGNNSTVHGV